MHKVVDIIDNNLRSKNQVMENYHVIIHCTICKQVKPQFSMIYTD
jgi:hypothetical protein